MKILLVISTVIALSTCSDQCWTCPPGYKHWFDIGLLSAPGGDRCACVQVTTPNAPAVNNCWTCSPGYVHWWLGGHSNAPGGDKCACVVKQSSTPTISTKAPSPANTPTDCWTCSPGYSHWWLMGHSSAPYGDRCACVKNNNSPTTTKTPTHTTTTPAPTTTRTPSAGTPTDCWTCSPGYVHWWLAGHQSAPNGDRCACVVNNSPTTTKLPSQTTTRSPSPTTTKIPTTNCWTCSPGYKHWFELGLSKPTDECACFPIGGLVPAPAPPASGGGSSNPGWNNSGPYAKYTGRMRTFVNAMTPGASDTGSVSFSAAVAPYSPWNPPPEALINQLLSILRAQTKFKTLVMYYIDQWTVPIIARHGYQMTGIVSLVVGGDNSGVINAAINMAKQYPDTIVGIACGNELAHQSGLTWNVVYTVTNCIQRLKEAGVVQPVGVMDTFHTWCSENESGCNTRWSAVSDHADWLGVNIYPYWNNVFSGNWPCNYYTDAALRTMEAHKRLINLYSDKPVVVTEWGWPGAPDGQTIVSPPNYVTGQQCGICNNANQKVMVQNMIDLYRQYQLPGNCFSAFREEWKGQGGGVTTIETQWGICSGHAPYNCMGAPQ